MRTAILKPGFLVSLKTSLKGGVNYKRIDIESEHTDATGAIVSKWETTREIPDKEDFERATEARGKARYAIASICCNSSFGLLCPFAKEDELNAGIAAARQITDAYNATGSSRIDVYAIVGRIAQDDAEAARAMGYEVRELLDAMKNGIAAADPAAIREAANKAKALGAMLSPDVAGTVSAAIIEARAAARAIVSRVEKAGEAAADVVKECVTAKLDSARFAFLDMDEQTTPVQTDAPAARGIELDAEDEPEEQPEPARQIETDTAASVTAAPANVRTLELF